MRALAPRVLAVLLLSIVATIVVGASAAMADSSGGVGISVTTTQAPNAATPTPTPTSAGSVGSGSSSSGASSSGSGTGTAGGSGFAVSVSGSAGLSSTVANTTSGGAATPAADDFDLGGIVFISGVSQQYGWSINPLDGESHASFTVRNVSSETFDSTADFTIVGPFNNVISEVRGIQITALKPGETRVVDATLTGLGQWTFYTTYATFIPPATVDGTQLSPITRDAFMFVLPWFLLVVAILVAGGYSVIRIVRDPEAAGFAGAAAPALAPGVTEGMA